MTSHSVAAGDLGCCQDQPPWSLLMFMLLGQLLVLVGQSRGIIQKLCKVRRQWLCDLGHVFHFPLHCLKIS